MHTVKYNMQEYIYLAISFVNNFNKIIRIITFFYSLNNTFFELEK